MTTADDYAEIVDLFAAIVRQMAEGTLLPYEVRDAFQAIVDRIGTGTAPTPASGRFASGEQQVSSVREWVSRLGLPITASQIDLAGASVPAFEGNEPLVPLTLCWTLGDLGTTIEAKLDIVRIVYGADMVSVVREFRTDAKHTKLVSGAPAFVPNRLWWQFIDLGANRFKAPSQVAPTTAAGIEVLDVICQHPVYVGQQDGSDTPYLDLPGLSVRVRGTAGVSTPDAVGGDSGRLSVNVGWDGSVYSDHAEPIRRAEPIAPDEQAPL